MESLIWGQRLLIANGFIAQYPKALTWLPIYESLG
jgi:hypothetical protein